MPSIPGYLYGSDGLARSPVSPGDFELLKATVLFSENDVHHLQLSADVLKDQIEEILDVWYGFVGSLPHLIASFARRSDGEPDPDYLAAVRRRFGQWILDTANARYDADWLAWQHEIGLRHHRARKNLTDGVDAAPIVPYRYLPALFYPVTATLKPFLARKGHDHDAVEKMHQAWMKSVLLQVVLWSCPYVRDGDF